MRLHRYFGSHADTTLVEKRLLLAQVSTFNDPFEFVHSFTGEYTVEQAERDLESMSERQMLEYYSLLNASNGGTHLVAGSPTHLRRRYAELCIKLGVKPTVDPFHCHKLADNHFRLCCFSLTNLGKQPEILLWSHYARSHKGVRIEFEFDENHLPFHPVIYSGQRCAVDLANSSDPNHTNEILIKTFQTKAAAWSYENEVRLIIQKECVVKKPIPLGYRYYFPFDSGCVKSVDFGINCDLETVKTVTTILKSEYPHATMRKAFHHSEDYTIEYRPI